MNTTTRYHIVTEPTPRRLQDSVNALMVDLTIQIHGSPTYDGKMYCQAVTIQYPAKPEQSHETG
jgi:hypothetical protein